MSKKNVCRGRTEEPTIKQACRENQKDQTRTEMKRYSGYEKRALLFRKIRGSYWVGVMIAKSDEM